MRRLWSPIAPLACIALLAGAAAACDVHSGGPLRPFDDYKPAVFITGEIDERPDAGWTNPSHGVTVFTNGWKANDPRLSGDVTYTYRTKGFGGLASDLRYAGVGGGTFVVVNEGGRWSGTATGFAAQVPDTRIDTISLDGEGAYAGLSAYLVMEGDDDGPKTFKGLLFPGPLPIHTAPPAS